MQGVVDGPVMVPSIYELTSVGLKNITGWPGCNSGKSLVFCVLYNGASSGMNSVLSVIL